MCYSILISCPPFILKVWILLYSTRNMLHVPTKSILKSTYALVSNLNVTQCHDIANTQYECVYCQDIKVHYVVCNTYCNLGYVYIYTGGVFIYTDGSSEASSHPSVSNTIRIH